MSTSYRCAPLLFAIAVVAVIAAVTTVAAGDATSSSRSLPGQLKLLLHLMAQGGATCTKRYKCV